MDTLGARTSKARQSCCTCARRQQGFTLVEVIISAGLLGFLALTATFFWVDSFRLVRTVNDDSAAIADGRALLERLAREIREVKYSTASGAYCVSTLPVTQPATQMVFKKTSGDFNPACGTNDFAVTVQFQLVSPGITDLSLTYAGAAPAVTRTLTSYASSFGIRFLKVDGITETTDLSLLRFVELSLTVQPPGVQATQTSTVVALRNQ